MQTRGGRSRSDAVGENVLRHCVDRESQIAALRRARRVQETLLNHNDTGGDEYERTTAEH